MLRFPFRSVYFKNFIDFCSYLISLRRKSSLLATGKCKCKGNVNVISLRRKSSHLAAIICLLVLYMPSPLLECFAFTFTFLLTANTYTNFSAFFLVFLTRSPVQVFSATSNLRFAFLQFNTVPQRLHMFCILRGVYITFK